MTIFKRTHLFVIFLITCSLALGKQHAQAFVSGPIRIKSLFCDLIRQTDYQSVNGYASQPEWSVEAFQEGQSISIANKQPAFGWMLEAEEQGVMQTAYQLLVADKLDDLRRDIGNMWNSGRVNGDESTAILYKGKALEPNKMYFWKVKVWDNQGGESAYSYTACFYTGELNEQYTTTRYPLQRSDQHPRIVEQRNDVFFVDFGKAAFGQLRLHLTGNNGDTVRIRFGEKLTKEGTIDRNPGGTIRYQEYMLPLQAGAHTYQIKFKKDRRNTGAAAIKMPNYIGEVLPFRFVEVVGYPGSLSKQDAVRSMIHYPFNDAAAFFHSSDTVLNKLWDLCKYSVKATSFAGVYIDGDRERIPYEADAYINQLCHYAMDSEYTLARYSHEYLIHHATWPTEWILQSVLMAWNDYLYTGDLRSASRYYADLKAKSLTALEEDNGLISTRTGKQTPSLLTAIHYKGEALRDIVDWPQSGILGLGKSEPGETDGFVFTDYNAVVNAYYYQALTVMKRLALALGKKEDATYYERKAADVYQAFQRYFFDNEQHIYRDGVGTDHASLHTNMFALAFGLVPDKAKSAVLDFIRSRGMACSVYGSQFLMDALYQGEDGNYALGLLTSTDERSWYNMIRAGSTITMEAWDNKYKPNQDWNHIWGAVPANIIPRKLMGIEPLAPGWSSFRIKPQLGDLKTAAIRVPTIKGSIEVHYEQKAETFLMKATIPANSTADIVIPAKKSKGKVQLILDKELRTVQAFNGWIKLAGLGSGSHEIEVRY